MANTYDKQAMKKFEKEVAHLLEKGVQEPEMREALLKAGCPGELIAKVISDAETIKEKDEGTIVIDFGRIFGGAKRTHADPSKIKHYLPLRLFGKIFQLIGGVIIFLALLSLLLVDQADLPGPLKVLPGGGVIYTILVVFIAFLVALPFLAFDNLVVLLIDNTQASQSAANYLKQLAGKK